MSERINNLLAIALIFLLAVSAFVAGYFTNDFIELRAGREIFNDEDEFALFWEAWARIENNFLGELPTSTELTYGAIRGVIGLLNDPYTVFLEPVVRDQERDSLRGTIGGIGAFLSREEGSDDLLLEPIPDNPAARAGILSGDILLAVDGVEITAAMTTAEVADLVRGEKDTAVVLTVLHPGEVEPVDIEIIRGDILIPSIFWRLLPEDETIGYIQQNRFSGESSNELRDAIDDLVAQGAERLILDLRGNGGGVLDAAVKISDQFLTDGPILYQQTRDEGEVTFSASAETTAPDIPLVILIDGNTASASEIVAGALRDRERAVLIGSSRSFGKGSVQLVFDLSDGSSVHVTSARWFTPDRQPLDQQGLEPDILVEVTQADIDNGRDAVLNAAIAYYQQN